MNFIVELLYKAQQKKPKWPFPWALQIQIRTFICQVIWNFRHDNLSQIVSDLEAVTSHLSLSRSVSLQTRAFSRRQTLFPSLVSGFFLVLPYDVDDNRHKFGNTADDRQFQHSHGESMLLKHM